MKDKFIRFLKDNHAFNEFKTEILPYALKDFNSQFEDGGAEFLLGDGCIFFWRQATTGVYWEKLNGEWVKLLGEETT